MYASFKITASKYSLKPLLKLVTSAFKIIYKQVESFYEQITFFYGMKSFLIFLNNQLVINSIKS